MSTDLSNARIVAWEEYDGATTYAARQEPSRGFSYTVRRSNAAGLVEAATLRQRNGDTITGLRILAEFPRTLASIVGDAPAFRAKIADPRPGEEAQAGVFAYRAPCGGWRVVSEWDGSPWSLVYTLETLARIMLDLTTVVPLYPREAGQ